MLNEKQIERMLGKLAKFEERLGTMLFDKVDELPMLRTEECGPLDAPPADDAFRPFADGETWGGEGKYCWLKGCYTVPQELDGKTLFLAPKSTFYEAMLWVDGQPFGTFCNKIVIGSHGNHYCDMIAQNVHAGQTIDIAMEMYTWHYLSGNDPWKMEEHGDFRFKLGPADICVKNELINEFYFDLKTVNQMVECLDKDSFRRADLIRTLLEVHKTVYYSVEDIDRETFLAKLAEADTLLNAQLAKKNSETTPFAGLIGHSHMDTAWLWHKGETLKKCARTYANELNLMAQYPEYTFIQSSAYHGDMIRRHYPQLFARIQQAVAAGRYEPNGGVWIECDCNITSGESMIRQFLWGQRFTRKYFGYTSNCFWLPDTFGYSASIPQIMKGCGVDYFLTTKMAWNDTTTFPYDTFLWKGIDGTKVFTHLNKTHVWPDPKTLTDYVVNGNDCIREKTVSDKRLISYGFGDGGGGPQFEMIEMARREKDLEGVPCAEHVLVGDFMKELEATSHNVSEYSGELYLELHRGTLTNQHTIKRNNRLAERNIHNLEFLTAEQAAADGAAVDGSAIARYVSTLLVNQFHDILPGTCLPRAHQESKAEMKALLEGTDRDIAALLAKNADDAHVSVTNTTSFDRCDTVYLDAREGQHIAGGYVQQWTETLDGVRKLAVCGVQIPAYGAVALTWKNGDETSKSAFKREGNALTTPHSIVTFDERGFITSFIDRDADRELRGEGYPLNTFLLAEDMPIYWDNWDIDADIECRFHDTAELLESRVVSDGAVEYRIRNRYRISAKSEILQDMIFHADSADVTFETIIDWQDDHRFLKTAFDVSVFADIARQEIQFGYLKRPTARNTEQDKAKFEVCNHKYTDLSETRYGVSILNDCKYGISVKDSRMHLSLHKGGVRPDWTGDHGKHRCTYVFHPHRGGFGAEQVIKPAYELNYPVLTADTAAAKPSFVRVDADNVVIETVKPCEDAQRAYILRMYEAEGCHCRAALIFRDSNVKLYATDMLEENAVPCDTTLSFRPFEIKTIKVVYRE